MIKIQNSTIFLKFIVEFFFVAIIEISRDLSHDARINERSCGRIYHHESLINMAVAKKKTAAKKTVKKAVKKTVKKTVKKAAKKTTKKK